jgi:hypothetical protein
MRFSKRVFIGDADLAEGRLLQRKFDNLRLNLARDPVRHDRLLTGDFLQRQIAAFVVEFFEPADRRRRRLCHAPRPVFRDRAASELGRGRHPAYRQRPARRALGRHPGRGDARVFEERAAHVRGKISRLTAEQAMTLRSTPLSTGQFLLNPISWFCGLAFHLASIFRMPQLASCFPRQQESRLDRHGASGGGVSLARNSTSLSTPDSTLNVV